MTLTITNLRVDERKGETVAYLIVNCCFTVKPEEHDEYLWAQAKGDSEGYHKVLTIDDPERYEEWIMDHWDLSETYDGYGRAWVNKDSSWRYISKFDCFHFREWIADCSVTRAIISELGYFKEYGKLPTVYRAIDEHIIFSHLRTLQTYWD
jgi:hypothetical protein